MNDHTIPIVFLVILAASMAPAANLTTHDMAARTGARLAPEPFASHWQAAFGGCHPDYMRDQPLGHENHRYAGLLCTREAIRCLRDGQINKALLLASTRSHYIHDSACIAHADVWRPRRAEDELVPGQQGAGVWSFLPARYRDYWLPIGERAPGMDYDPLAVDKPPVPDAVWDSVVDAGREGSMHFLFDRIHNMAIYPGGFPLERVPRATNWSAYDREFYARWVAECLALEVLDRESVLARTGAVRFASPERFQHIRDLEMQNLASATATYYRYLTVAAKTELDGDIERLLPSADRFALLARRQARIYVAPDAPWPLQRACHLLAIEMARASFRNRGQHGSQYAANLTEACDSLLQTVPIPDGEADRRVLIGWKLSPEGLAAAADNVVDGNRIIVRRTKADAGYTVLRGEDLQSTIHLVDAWLDLANAPLNGRTPTETMFEVFRLEWPGNLFIEELRATPDDQLLPKFHRLPNIHTENGREWADLVYSMVRPNTDGHGNLSGPIPPYWNHLLVDLPLPSGRRIDFTSQRLLVLEHATDEAE